MANSISKMNRSIYRASFHLLEAGKHLSNVSDFREESNTLVEMANELISIIKPEQEKITEEKMNSILDEIINFSESK